MNLSRSVLDYYALLLSGVSHCYSKDIHYFSHQEKDEVWFLSSSAEKQSICFFGLSFGSSSSEKEMSVFHFALQLEKRGDKQHGRQIICNTTQLCPLFLENSILAWTFPWVFKETITHITSYYFPHMKKTQRAPTRPTLTNLVRHWPPTVDGSQCQMLAHTASLNSQSTSGRSPSPDSSVAQWHRTRTLDPNQLDVNSQLCDPRRFTQPLWSSTSQQVAWK